MVKVRTLLLGFFCLFLIKSFAQQDQRIHAAYVLAFGRDASPEELNYWLGRGSCSIGKLIEFHRRGLVEYPSLHRETINRAYIDVLGSKPTENEMKYWMNGVDLYIQLINTHLKFLKSSIAGYERVISASYFSVFNRAPNTTEITFWKKQGIIPFFLLTSYHENSKRNNSEARNHGKENVQNLPSVSAILFSPTIAAEASKFVNTDGSSVMSYLVRQLGKNIIVTGKGNINAEHNF